MRPILRDTLQGPVAGAVAGGLASAVGGKLLGGGGGSKSRTSSKPKDMTPQEFVGLRPEVAAQLQNLLAAGGGQMAPGPYAAPLGGNEQTLLDNIMQATAQPSDATAAGQSFLQSLLSGGQPVGADPLAALSVDPSSMQGGVNVGEVNPFLAGAIEAAQRPLIDQFTDVIAPALRADFTLAGQQIQGQGSSPFQMAAARSQAGLANALGDISSKLAFQDLQQRQMLQSQEFQQLRDLMVGQELGGRQQDVTARGQDIQGQLAGQQNQLDAASVSAGIDRSQIDNMLSGLEAQALPRLIQQLGIDRGLEEFRRLEDQLLQALQMAGQVSSPTTASVTRSSTTGVSPFTQAFGGAMGSALAGGVSNMFGG